MKTLAVFAALALAASTSFGQPAPAPQPQPLPQPPEVQPVRHAKAHFIISKNTIIPTPQGATSNSVIACDVTVDVPVFDLRPFQNGWSYYTPGFSCATTVDGKPASIGFSAGVTIGASFATLPTDSVKSVFASLGVVTADGKYFNGLNNGAWSRDLDWKSLGLYLSSNMVDLCMKTGSDDSVFNPPKLQKSGRQFFMKQSSLQDPLPNDPKPADPTTPVCNPKASETFSASVEITD